MLTIKKRGKKGIWWIFGTVNGQRIRESTGLDSKDHAENKRVALEKELLDEAVHGKKLTGTFADAVILYKQAGGSPRFLEPLVRYFGQMRLSTIDALKVSEFITATYPHSKPQTVNRQVHTPLTAVWNVARDAGLCGAPEFGRRPKQPKRQAPEFATDDVLATLLPHCDLEERALVLFLSYDAARASELCRVMDKHVDWKRCTVHLPRTKGGPREVHLPPLVYEAMLPLKGHDPIFGCNDRFRLNKRLKAAWKRAGLPHLGSRGIGRHCFAARLLGQGYSLKHVQEAGGWSENSLAMLARYYGHLEKSRVEAAVRSSDTNLAQLLQANEKAAQYQQLKKA